MNDSFGLHLRKVEVRICLDLVSYKCLPDSLPKWHAMVFVGIVIPHISDFKPVDFYGT